MQKTYLYNSDLIIYLKQMKTKYLITFIIFCIVTNTFSQTSLNDYKYVIVPNKFDFLKEADQYQLNSLTKFLFNKYGFTAILDDETYPEDLASNRCLALKADVKNDKGFLKTKLFVVLKNCKNETIYTSEIGQSKEKEFRVAYNLALRDAFKSIKTIKYTYKPNEKAVVLTNKSNSTPKQVEKLEEAIIIPEKEIIDTNIQIATIETKTEIESKNESNILYAQEIATGFQVVDSTPKVVMILFSTPKQEVFIVKGKDAIVYKEDGFWYLSENNGKSTTTKTLNIKF